MRGWPGWEHSFHNIAVPLRAYELRTGNLVFDGRVEIGGASCPNHFVFSGRRGTPPPPHWSVVPSEANVRDAFAGLITRT